MEYALGRQEAFDERSRAFGITDVLGEARPRSYTWGCDARLNQGQEGHCVGFCAAAEVAAKPVPRLGLDDAFGHQMFFAAQTIDRREGRYWNDGASILAGAKAMVEGGYATGYRWAFGERELRLAVGNAPAGPAMLGLAWHQESYDPDDRGYIAPTGAVVGGHAILVRGYSIKDRRYLLHNSWGSWWGGKGGAPPGCAWVDQDVMAGWLAADGEVCIPVGRKNPR